jgi:hypothetical protein
MIKYQILIETDALQDIRNASEWYDKQGFKLGHKFQEQVKKQINSLKISPLRYCIRYAEVRCMHLIKFPFMVHFSVDNQVQTVNIFAVTHTSRNPEIWKQNLKS